MKKAVDGASPVNNDHPQVIEYGTMYSSSLTGKKDGSLDPLPAKHVDKPGMALNVW